MQQEKITEIEQMIDYQFKDKQLLIIAMTHSSSVENRDLSNERLEFLGDSVLGMVICNRLYEKFPHYLEGDLTKVKSTLVSRKTCSQVTSEIGLQKYMKVGKGMTSSKAITGSVAAGLLEALIAAIYQDGGLEEAKKFILKYFEPLIDLSNSQHGQGNYKSLLQQYVQQNFNSTPSYALLDEKGPDHNKCFETQIVINGRQFNSAWGINKKESEQKAAYNALIELGIITENEAFTQEQQQ
jgi:ribonuclease-3